MCSAALVVSQLQQFPLFDKVALRRIFEKRVEHVESYFVSSFCILLHTTSIEFFLRVGFVRPHKSVQRFHARISALLHWNNLENTYKQEKIFHHDLLITLPNFPLEGAETYLFSTSSFNSLLSRSPASCLRCHSNTSSL